MIMAEPTSFTRIASGLFDPIMISCAPSPSPVIVGKMLSHSLLIIHIKIDARTVLDKRKSELLRDQS